MAWVVGTVTDVVQETSAAVTIKLDVPDWVGHRAGQHVDVRLTGEDGYAAHRTYSIASAPQQDTVDLTVVRFDDGEVSPYLTTLVEVGDQLELRGPVGGYFTWDGDEDRSIHLVGGGSGVVPLVAMLRHHARLDHGSPMHLLYSARTIDDVLFADEIAALSSSPREVTTTLTRQAPPDWHGPTGRVGLDLLAATGWPAADEARCYVCGPTPFVETVSAGLVSLGHPPENVKTERFGPTGARHASNP